MSSKYTIESLEPIVKNSISMYGVLRSLGLRYAGGNWKHIADRIKYLGIDTSHFRGLGSNHGINHVGGVKRIEWRDVLVYNRKNGRRETQRVLRRALIESGISERCEICNLDPIWHDKPLSLQIDHKNGDFLDNRPGNPRFLCPNCHTQTENYGSKKFKLHKMCASCVPRTKTVRTCLKCGKQINIKSKYCVECARIEIPSATKITWPNDGELQLLVWQRPMTTLAKEFGVSDKAILNRCKKHGIKNPPTGYWSKIKHGIMP